MSNSIEGTTHVTVADKPRKKKRIFFWFFLAVQALFLIWIIAGANSGSTPTDCGSLSAQACQDANDVGTGLGVMLLIGLWFMTDMILATIYGIWRLVSLRPQERTV